MTTALMSRRLL